MINASGIWLKAHSSCALRYQLSEIIIISFIWRLCCCCRSQPLKKPRTVCIKRLLLVIIAGDTIRRIWHNRAENTTVEMCCWSEQNWKIQTRARTLAPHTDTLFSRWHTHTHTCIELCRICNALGTLAVMWAARCMPAISFSIWIAGFFFHSVRRAQSMTNAQKKNRQPRGTATEMHCTNL